MLLDKFMKIEKNNLENPSIEISHIYHLETLQLIWLIFISLKSLQLIDIVHIFVFNLPYFFIFFS
jgi:hypothetical protein